MTIAQTGSAGNSLDVPSVSAQRSRWTLVAVALATFMTYLDNNIVNVADGWRTSGAAGGCS